MTNYEEQRQAINHRILECVEKMSEANRCEKLITSTREDCERLENKWQELKQVLKKEEHDVEKLSNITFTNFLHTLLNNKEEKLDKERREVLTAKLKCDGVLSQLQQCRRSLEKLTVTYDKLKYAKEDYHQLLNEKRDFILSHMPERWNDIEKYMDEDRRISMQLKELNEAIDAGDRTMNFIEQALNALQSAANWGTWDMLGGGVLSTMAKRSKMSEAQNHITNMQNWISSFARELKDVNTSIESDLELDSFLGFADYFFDGFFVDWAVQSKIHQAQDKVRKTQHDVNTILRSLNSEADTLNNRKKELHKEITMTIENA